MNARFSPEDDAFRAEIRAFLEAEWPGGTGDASVDSDDALRGALRGQHKGTKGIKEAFCTG